MILCHTEHWLPGKPKRHSYRLGEERLPETWITINIIEDLRIDENAINALVRKLERKGCLQNSYQPYLLSELLEEK